MTLKKRQQQALKILIEGYNTFLSGEAGTGKSFVIELFKKHLDSVGKKYVVCAPTGLAALNVEGITLHRTFGLSINILDFNATMKNVEEAEVIIIDEISMCRKDTFQKIARAIFKFENPLNQFSIEKEANVCRKKQIVVVGDFFQLPPVLTDQDLEIIKENPQYGIKLSKDDLYAFQCDEWNLFNFKNIVLNEVVRQSDKNYIDNLNLIRRGDKKGLEFIEKKAKKSKTRNAIYLCSKNKDAERINQSNLKKINEKEVEYWSEENGDVKLEDRTTQRCLKLKKGARVMSIVNIKEDVANGMLGTVVDLKKDKVTIKFDNGKEHTFGQYKWEIQGFKKQKIKNQKGEDEEKTVVTEIGTFQQIPLKLAWAITIHKSQGQTYEAVNLNPDCFCDGQLYVGLSRAKDLKKLHLISEIKTSYLKTSNVVKNFYKKIESEDVRQVEAIEVEGNIEDNKIDVIKGRHEQREAKEEYVTIQVPKNLEKRILSILEGEVDSDNKEINTLHKRIEELQVQLDQVLASANRRPKISKNIEMKIIALRKEGFGMNKIAKQVKCGDGTVRRVLKDYGIK